MAYKVKNISEERFSFEGVTLEPGEESVELSPDSYQRLLALYYGRKLVPVEDTISEEPQQQPDQRVIDVVSDNEEHEVSVNVQSVPEESAPASEEAPAHVEEPPKKKRVYRKKNQ